MPPLLTDRSPSSTMDRSAQVRVTMVLCVVAAIGGLVLHGQGYLSGSALTAVVVVAAAAEVLACAPSLRRPFAYAMLALSMVDVSPFRLSGSYVRIYQIGSVLLPLCLIGVRRKSGTSYVLPVSLAVLTGLSWLSLTSTLSRADTLHVSAGQTYLVLLALMVVELHRREVITIDRTLDALLLGCSIGSLAALGEFAISLFGVDFHVFHQSGIPWARPAGLMLEPDWAGLVAAMGLIIAVFSFRRGRRALYAVVAGLNLAVVGLTAVRSVLVALVVTAFVLAVAPRVPRRSRALGATAVLGLVAAGAALFTFSPELSQRYNPSQVRGGVADNGAGNSRLGVLRLIEHEGPERMWRGHGAGSIAYTTSLPEKALKYGGGGVLNGGHGSTNLFASTFYDLGLPGLLAVIVVAASWLLKSWRAAHPSLLPLALLQLATFQLTNGFRFGFVWVFMALATVSHAAGRAQSEDPAESVRAPAPQHREERLPQDHEI